jgi:branched-subunit amino acid ABC-type transport system permease component
MFASVDTTSGALVVLTVIGTIAFAVSGVMAAAHSAMDWLGALVLAVVVAVGGGTMRDVLIGNLPVMWVDTKWPVVVALGTAVVGIVLLRIRPSLDPTEWRLYLAADAIGLGAFVGLHAQPYGALFRRLVQPRLGPPADLQRPRSCRGSQLAPSCPATLTFQLKERIRL